MQEQKKKNYNDDADDDIMARRRIIAAETEKIQKQTQLVRKQKMKELIGDDADTAFERQCSVKQALDDYTYKGTHPDEKAKQDLIELLPYVQDELNIEKRKEEYYNHVEAFRQKGQEHLLVMVGYNNNDDDNDNDDSTNHDGHGQKHHHDRDDRRGRADVDCCQRSPSKLVSDALAVTTSSNNDDSGTKTSPLKQYLALAQQNALRSDDTGSIGPPGLYMCDSTRADEATQRSKQPTTVNALTPIGWDGCTYYTLIDLRQRKVPKNIDWKNREQYLSPEEFALAFEGMTKDEFASQPKWKRDKMKQRVYLF